MIEWLRKRISALEYVEPIHIKQFKKAEDDDKKRTGAKSGLMSLLNKNK